MDARAGVETEPAADELRQSVPLLAIQFRGKSVVLVPEEAVRIRDALRPIEGEIEQRLGSLLEAKTTELLAAPLYAGTVTLRIDQAEEAVLLTVGDRWARAGDLPDSPRLTLLWAELGGAFSS